MSVFLERFTRHDHGEGLKGQTTHYCPGCGHGLVQRFLAEAIEALGVQDRTVAISPVGCAVFLYYYLDVGNTQAPHGRAPAVALGHKLAHPESVVVSYQGDGDLAAIGLTEAVHAAQLGVPITVVFVNNAIYGMTGGQLAPTTLAGQKTSTSPRGRDRTMGAPLKIAEMMAQLDGPVYVERVALFDVKQRVRAKKAIEKAVRMQVENRGFAFVEVLAECPTHLGLGAAEAERWVREQMLPVFPLGVKKDVAGAEWGSWPAPSFDPAQVTGALLARAAPPPERSGEATPWTRGELGLKLAGAGGDGAQTAAMLLARAAVRAGLDATHLPSYGPESRGGTSFADVRIAPGEVLSPDVPEPDVLVAFNAPSLARFGPEVRPGGVVVYDRSVIQAPPPPLAEGVTCLGIPCSEIALALGSPRVKNVVALGALEAAAGLFGEPEWLESIEEALKKKASLAALNEEAFRRGLAAGRVLAARG